MNSFRRTHDATSAKHLTTAVTPRCFSLLVSVWPGIGVSPAPMCGLFGAAGLYGDAGIWSDALTISHSRSLV